MFFNPPKQATRNKQFQEIKKIASFSHLSSKSLIKMPLRVFFEAGSYKKYWDIKKNRQGALQKTGKDIEREIYRNMGIFYAMILVSLKKLTPLSGFIWEKENKNKTNFHLRKPCYLASLTITNASLRSHESHTRSSFSFCFLNQIKLGQSWPSVNLLPSLLTQLCCSCL